MPPDGTGTTPGTTPDLLTQLLPYLAGLGSVGAQVAAAALNQGNLDKGYNYLNGIGLNGLQNSQNSLGQGQTNLDSSKWTIGDLLSGQNPWAQAQNNALGNSQQIQGLLPGLIGGAQNNSIYQDPNLAAELQGITNLGSGYGGIANIGSELLNNGGITNTQVPLGQYAQSLMSGSTPIQQALTGAGTGILNNGGLTPALQAALGQASGIVNAGGATPLTNQLAQRGLQLASGNPLLSMAQAAGFASDQAGRNFANAAQTARSQAEARGAGPGDIVASGTGNGTQADFSDQALQGQAQAMQNAMTGQQGLNLQQLAQGLNTGLSAADIQRTLELGGLSSVAGLTGAQTGMLGTGGGLANSSAQLGNTGGQFYNALLGLQQGNTALGGQLGMEGLGGTQGTLQQAISDLLSGRSQAAGLGSTLASLLQNSAGQQIGAANAGVGDVLQGAGQLGQLGSTWLGNSANALNVYGNTGNSVANLLKTPNQFSNVLTNIAGTLGAAAGQPRLSGGITIGPNGQPTGQVGTSVPFFTDPSMTGNPWGMTWPSSPLPPTDNSGGGDYYVGYQGDNSDQ